MNVYAGEKLKEELGENVLFVQTDVSNYVSVENLVDNTLFTFGTIDILINNAGITDDATLLKMTPEQFQKVLNINLTGVMNLPN